MLVALGDGDRAAGPQRTAQRTVRGDHAHDQVTETGDQVGTGRVELDDFVLTDNVGFFGHDLSQHEIAERDDVGGKYQRQRINPVLCRRKANAENCIIQHFASQREIDNPHLNFRERNFTDQRTDNGRHNKARQHAIFG